MRTDELYATGLTLNFFESNEFEAKVEEGSLQENAAKVARNALRILMMGWRNDWKDVLSLQVLKAVFIERDRELTKGMRLAFQQGFNFLFEQLNNSDLTPEQFRQAQFYLSNCLTLLPFADLTPYESFTIPQWINKQWKMVEYKVTPIELTPTKGFWKLFINDEDRVFAYGLEPLIDKKAEPHLIFMGTTYPKGQGFNTQIYTDSEDDTPGSFLYRHGASNIERWLNKFSGEETKVHVCGTSLGGSLSLMLGVHQGEKLSRVDALNPTGLYEPWFPSRYDRWTEIEKKPAVFIQKQGNDPVSAFGVWKNEWNILHVVPPEDKQGPNGFVDHALNYAGFSETQFLGVNTEEDNAGRKKRNFLLFSFVRSLLFYLVMVPYHYLILPLVRYAWNNKLLLLVTAVLVGLSFLIPVFAPAVSATTLLLFAMIPLAINLVYQFYQTMSTILGFNEVTFAKLHDPRLQRNEAMDIYSNELNETFKCEEIREYYTARRCILKDKPFLSEDKNASLEEGKTEKQRILETVQNPDNDLKEVSFTKTAAKIHDMRQTVAIMQRFGFHNNEALRNQELREQNEAYKLGKMRGLTLS